MSSKEMRGSDNESIQCGYPLIHTIINSYLFNSGCRSSHIAA